MGAQPRLSRPGGVTRACAQRPRCSPGPAHCTWLGPRGWRLSGRRSCAGSGRAVAGRRRTRCLARRAWLGHSLSLALSLYRRGTPRRPPPQQRPPSSRDPGLAPSGPGQHKGGANCLGFCIPLAMTIRIATQTPAAPASSASVIFSPPNEIHSRRQFFITSALWRQELRDQRTEGSCSRPHDSPRATSASASPKPSQETSALSPCLL